MTQCEHDAVRRLSPRRLRRLAPIRLPDGRRLAVRFIRPDDAPRLQALVADLSPVSVYSRFFSPRRELPWPEAVRLATVDGQTRDALVAWVPAAGDTQRLVAVARYDQVNADTVEVAIVVLDAYQGRGIGTALLRRLLRLVRRRGFRFVQAAVLSGNGRAYRLLQATGRVSDVVWDGSTRWVRLDLQRPARLRARGMPNPGRQRRPAP